MLTIVAFLLAGKYSVKQASDFIIYFLVELFIILWSQLIFIINSLTMFVIK